MQLSAKSILMFFWVVAFGFCAPLTGSAEELVPGLDACLKAANELGDPDSPKFAGAGEARDQRLECFQSALEQVEAELLATVQQAKRTCINKDGDDFGVPQQECKARYDKMLETGRAYKDANKTMLEMYWVGCPTCLFDDTVEWKVRETKRQIKYVKRAASSYLDGK